MGDTLITIEEEIGQHIVTYYDNFFTEDDNLFSDCSILDFFDWNLVSDAQNVSLTAMPSVEEVRDAVFGLDSTNAPGPDGFGGFFYHKCWDVIADDVFQAVSYLFSTTVIP